MAYGDSNTYTIDPFAVGANLNPHIPGSANAGRGGYVSYGGNQYATRAEAQQARAAAEYQKQMDAFNAAQEARYTGIDTGYSDLLARSMEAANKVGGTNKADINRVYDALAGRTRAMSTAQGLGNTTVPTTLLRGVERDRARELARAEGENSQYRIGLDANLTGQQLQFRERRTDTPPDYNQLAQLMQAQGSGYLGGMGYGGYGMGGGFGAGLQQAAVNAYGGAASNGYRVPTQAMGAMPSYFAPREITQRWRTARNYTPYSSDNYPAETRPPSISTNVWDGRLINPRDAWDAQVP